jgi:hypothetical protein
MSQPSDDPRNGKEDRKVVEGEAHRSVDQARVKVHVWVEIPLGEVVVGKSRLLQLEGDVEKRLGAGDGKDLLSQLADDGRAGVVLPNCQGRQGQARTQCGQRRALTVL